MNGHDNLTTWEKSMNTAKVGTVFIVRNLNQISEIPLIPCALCEVNSDAPPLPYLLPNIFPQDLNLLPKYNMGIRAGIPN